MIPLRVVLQMEEAQKRARDLAGRFSNFRPVMEGPVRKLVTEMIGRQFSTRGRFGGTPWAPLAKSTIERKRQHPEWIQAPMRRTDRMLQSLTNPNSADFEEIITPQGYTRRSLVRYAKYHQSTEPRSGRLPRRPVIPDTIPQPYIVKLRNMLKGYLITGEVVG